MLTRDIMMAPVPLQPKQNIHQYFWQTQDEGNSDRYNRSANWPKAKRLFGTSKLGWDISADMTGGQRKTLHERLLESVRTRGKLTRWLLDNTDWSLFITSFSEMRRAGHYFCPEPQHQDIQPDEDLLLSCYQQTDSAIGHVLEGIDRENTHVIVFSLSGMGANNSQSHFLTEVLDRFNHQYTAKPGIPYPSSPKQGITRRLREKLPGPVQVEIAKRVSQGMRDWVVNRAYTGRMEWDRTLAFHVLSGGQGYIRWNVEGREGAGVLALDGAEIDRYSKALKEELLSLTAVCNGRKIVKKLVDIPSIYPGPYAKYLPDISVIWEDMAPVTEIVSARLGKFKGRIGTGRGGNHRNKAFVFTSIPESGERTDPGHIAELGRYIESLFTH